MGKDLTPRQKVQVLRVSIQLVFPASGKASKQQELEDYAEVSIQLVFPASGKVNCCFRKAKSGERQVSIQLVFPASGKVH